MTADRASLLAVPDWRVAWPIVGAASVMLSIAMGIRQSLGVFMLPVTQDLAIPVSQFAMAIAVQNLVWGLLQPITGAISVRYGFRPIMLVGSALYVLGLILVAVAHETLLLLVGAGLAIGAAMSCTGVSVALAVSGRPVMANRRSMVFGVVAAVGSLGASVLAPIGQQLATAQGWRAAVTGFALLSLLLLPAAWLAGRTDALSMAGASAATDDMRTREVIGTALRHPPFVIMTASYCVCGMQLIFLTTHLPSYLAVCGADPMLGAQALGMIGVFNVLGSFFFGWAGGRANKLALLGAIYVLRSLGMAWYFSSLPTVQSTLLFAAVMGFLWFGVSPLVDGTIGQIFGLRWQALLAGVAFSSHQFGSFAGAYAGGLFFELLGSYDLAWRLAVGIGLAAGIVQIVYALARPPSALARLR